MMMLSRRSFLSSVSTAAALGAASVVAPRWLTGAARPRDLVVGPDEALLRELSLIAVEAARAAGAAFADVRVASGQLISLTCRATSEPAAPPTMAWPSLSSQAEYGIRAIVDGAWGFAGGSELTRDAVSAVARQAVARARSNRPRRPRTLELAPVPADENGAWATPIEEDPFDVPLGEQADLALAAVVEAARVQGIRDASVNLVWGRSARVFASSEGALITQRIAAGWPSALVWADRPRGAPGYVIELAEALRQGPQGYELVRRVDLRDELRRTAERAVREAARPQASPAEVGRFDLVLGAPAVASLLNSTVGLALNLELALGYYANSFGTSFAAPPADILGTYRIASPLLTVHADRTSRDGAATVGWDDEGVPAGEHTLVRDGIVMDYLTNRQTAVELASGYESRGEPVRSRGCASGVGQVIPSVRPPNLTIEPGNEALSVEDLIAGTRRGFFVEQCSPSSDQQVLNTQAWADARRVREIRDGRLGDRVRDLAFQFITPIFWRGMDTIGGAGSMIETVYSGTPHPLQVSLHSVRAVPARMRDVHMLNYGRTL